jgi:hypothetical protein
MVTLQRLMGRNCFGEDGFLHLGIRAMNVLFITSGDLLSFRMPKDNERKELEDRQDLGPSKGAFDPPFP